MEEEACVDAYHGTGEVATARVRPLHGRMQDHFLSLSKCVTDACGTCSTLHDGSMFLNANQVSELDEPLSSAVHALHGWENRVVQGGWEYTQQNLMHRLIAKFQPPISTISILLVSIAQLGCAHQCF